MGRRNKSGRWVLTAKQAPAGPAPPRRSVCAPGEPSRPHCNADRFRKGDKPMMFSSIDRSLTARRLRPVVESLEDRLAPATFNIAAGDVAGLYAALNTAYGNGEDDTVNLAAGATYTLTTPSDGLNGLNLLADGGWRLTIKGNGATIARAAAVGTPEFRIIRIESGNAVTLSGLKLSNGRISGIIANWGGGIFNEGTLTMTGCTVSGNSSTNFAGGIFND